MKWDFAVIREAAARVKPYVHRTPVFTCRALNRICGAELYFKMENFQKTGAFKARGAVNAVFSLSEEDLPAAVVTHSSGNHAAAIAYAASCRGLEAHVVMPENASPVKKAAVKGYGAQVTYCLPGEKERQEALREVIARTKAHFIHPYDDARVIAGQATTAMELAEEVPALDAIIAPVGGGGLLGGTTLAVKYLLPRAAVYGAEPKGADDACRSLQEGRIIPSVDPRTMADGLLTSLGELTYPLIRDHVQAIFTATEEEIAQAMRLVWERMKAVIEPSAALPLAVLLEKPADLAGRKIGLILSGGNADLGNLPWQGNNSEG